MILTYECRNCLKIFKLGVKACDRGELDQYHNGLKESCSNCSYENEIFANGVKAERSFYTKYVFLIALLIDIVIFILAYKNFPESIITRNSGRQYIVFAFIFIFPFIMAGRIIKNEDKAIRNFNRYYV